MSEEEKKSFEELKKEINKPLEVPEDKCNTFILYNIDNAKIILNLIEKQQKEIDELQSYIKEYLIPKSTINLLYVSKDKIRAKIKELDEKWHVLYRDSEVKDILEKLLEEE